MNKKQALIAYLKLKEINKEEELEDKRNGEFTFGSKDYIVLTDKQATARAKYEIKELVWAFKSGFLANHMPSNIKEDLIEIIQEKCEEANPIILRLIKNFNKFTEDAIRFDGRSHFISSYDGQENECGGFYIYRIN